MFRDCDWDVYHDLIIGCTLQSSCEAEHSFISVRPYKTEGRLAALTLMMKYPEREVIRFAIEYFKMQFRSSILFYFMSLADQFLLVEV